MNIHLHGVHLPISDSLKSYLQKKTYKLNKHFYHFGGDACAVSKQAPPKAGFQIDADWLAL